MDVVVVVVVIMYVFMYFVNLLLLLLILLVWLSTSDGISYLVREFIVFCSVCTQMSIHITWCSYHNYGLMLLMKASCVQVSRWSH